MKKILYVLMAALTISFMTGCSKGGDGAKTNPLIAKISTEWKLTSWNGAAPDGFAIYAAFSTNKTFEVYQQFEQLYFQKYTGTYDITDTLLSGTYSDMKLFGSNYNIEFSEDGQTMTLTSTTGLTEEVEVFTQTTIPEDVKSGATVVDATRAGEFRIF